MTHATLVVLRMARLGANGVFPSNKIHRWHQAPPYAIRTAMMGHIAGGVMLGGVRAQGCRSPIKPFVRSKENLDAPLLAPKKKLDTVCVLQCLEKHTMYAILSVYAVR